MVASCSNCNFSLPNEKDQLECHYDAAPFPIVTPINWCGRYDSQDARRHNERKAWYQAELEKMKEEAAAKRKTTRTRRKTEAETV